MDLRALRYFVETVRQRSFTLAAQRLNVTQSTISKMVRQLEDEVGQPLLIRSTRSLQMTDVGRVVFERGIQALALMQGLHEEVADLAALDRGHLTIGIPPMVNVFFSPLIQRFRQKHPGITLSVREGGGELVEQWITDGELDVGVSILPVPEGLPLDSSVLGRYPVCLLGTREVMESMPAQPSLKHLDGRPVVMLSEGFALGRQLRRWWAAHNVHPVLVAESGQWDFLLSMAQAGMGVAILPSPLLDRLNLPPVLVSKPLPASELDWVVAHVWGRDRYISHAAKAWLASCGALNGEK
ncbi:MAG TPA: LysR family transcriptional regulator [Aquabacterium sp.]|nr:LysR family transcriptional regulator [Aquabacterium sp.]